MVSSPLFGMFVVLGGLHFIILGLMDLGYDEDEIVTFIIEEWEKIRNNPK